MYEPVSEEIKSPKKSVDPIANITIERFNEAVRWQSQERVYGDLSLRQTLQNCYDQFNGHLSPEDQQIVDELGVDAYVNLTSMKACTVQSFLTETLVQPNTLPWAIEATPLPELSIRGEDEAVQKVLQELYNGQFNGDVMELITAVKTQTLRKEHELAITAAEHMEKLIIDQCLQGGWNTAMKEFLTDFTVYPFAVLHGPIPVRRPQLQWGTNNIRVRSENFYEFKTVSPWDFWYSPDSPDTQRGTGIFLRQRWTRQNLLQAAEMKSYIKANVVKVLEGTETIKDYNFRWMSGNPDQLDNKLIAWSNGSTTIDALVHYGFFSGKELSDYGITGLDLKHYYNATVTVIDGVTIQVIVHDNPNLNIRPVFTASFYKQRDRIASCGIAQRVRDVERCFITALRYLMSNAAGASGPITEADYTRFSKYMGDEDIGRLIPNTVYPVDSEIGTNNPAFRFYTIPSAIPHYMQLLQYFMDLADRVTNIPAALHGTAQGSGANRTFRGAAMLQGNAVKAISASVSNIDDTVFGPLGQLIYSYNMLYERDDSIKGDCKILAQGSAGLLQRELDRQNSYEILQMVSSAGQQLMAMPTGQAIMMWALNNVLGNMGVPKELLSTSTPMPAGDVPGPGGEMPPAEQPLPMGGEQ